MKDMRDKFLDEDDMGMFPKSARVSLEQMRVMIDDSESPADVAVALSVGMAFVLSASSNPESTLSIMVSAASQIATKLMKDMPGEISAGREFLNELSDRLDAMKKKEKFDA